MFYGFDAERNGQAYKKAGVHQFKKVVPFGDSWFWLYSKLFSKEFRLIKTPQDAGVWVIFTVVVEVLHLMAFLTMFYFIINAMNDKSFLELGVLFVINMLVNFYPILVQRYNRLRILKVYGIAFRDLQHAGRAA